MSVAGNWKLETKSPFGNDESTIELAVNGAELSGKMTGKDGETEIFEGAVDGNNASWKAKIEKPMPITLEFTTSVNGDSISGTVKLGNFGNATLSGSRA